MHSALHYLNENGYLNWYIFILVIFLMWLLSGYVARINVKVRDTTLFFLRCCTTFLGSMLLLTTFSRALQECKAVKPIFSTLLVLTILFCLCLFVLFLSAFGLLLSNLDNFDNKEPAATMDGTYLNGSILSTSADEAALISPEDREAIEEFTLFHNWSYRGVLLLSIYIFLYTAWLGFVKGAALDIERVREAVLMTSTKEENMEFFDAEFKRFDIQFARIYLQRLKEVFSERFTGKDFRNDFPAFCQMLKLLEVAEKRFHQSV